MGPPSLLLFLETISVRRPHHSLVSTFRSFGWMYSRARVSAANRHWAGLASMTSLRSTLTATWYPDMTRWSRSVMEWDGLAFGYGENGIARGCSFGMGRALVDPVELLS